MAKTLLLHFFGFPALHLHYRTGQQAFICNRSRAMQEFLTDNGVRFGPSSSDAMPPPSEEMFVTDDRGGLTPSQMVERKLMSLQNAALPVSRLESSDRYLAVS
jgi:hypothetical protein